MKVDLFDFYIQQAAHSFSGWDFNYLTQTGRMTSSPLKWNYYNLVIPHLIRAKSLLDMGTGGGEVLSRFAPLPGMTYATEQYIPNLPVAKKRLEPLGVLVFQIDEKFPNNEHLPFESSFFDLIINRHESFYPPELHRILKNDGLFITQQVGLGLYRIKKQLTGIDAKTSNWGLQSNITGLESAGFRIVEAMEDKQYTRFYDIGAIAYWLKAIPWIIEDVTGKQDFTIEKYKDKLHKIHDEIQKVGYYEDSFECFAIIAGKS